MRFIAVALAFCFMLAPLEAKTRPNRPHVVKIKKSKMKAHKAPKHSKAKIRRVTSN